MSMMEPGIFPLYESTLAPAISCESSECGVETLVSGNVEKNARARHGRISRPTKLGRDWTNLSP